MSVSNECVQDIQENTNADDYLTVNRSSVSRQNELVKFEKKRKKKITPNEAKNISSVSWTTFGALTYKTFETHTYEPQLL